MLATCVSDRHLPTGDRRRGEVGRRDDAVRDDLVVRRTQRVDPLDHETRGAEPRDARAHRVEHGREILDLGLDEELENGAVIVAEWGEGAESLFGERAFVIQFGLAGEDERDISIELRGASDERSAVLESALGEAV